MNDKNTDNSITWEFDYKRFEQLWLHDSSYKIYLAQTGNCQWFIRAAKTHRNLIEVYGMITLEVENITDQHEVSATIKRLRSRNFVQSYSFNSQRKSWEIYSFKLFDRLLENYPIKITLEWKDAVSIAFLKQPIIQKSNSKEKPVSEKYELSHLNELSEDFQGLLFDEHLSDVTIESHSTVYKAHKVILCSRSPVFKAMFASAMQETMTDRVTIVDMDTEVLRSMIQFMYSGHVDIHSLGEAASLLHAAEKYQIQSLKKGLIKYMMSVLSEDNVFKLLELADMFDEDLKADALKFIGSHYKILRQKKDWNDLKTSKPTLALEVYALVEKLFV